jgi:hypothetical protein
MAEKLAAEHKEPVALVLAELLAAIDSGELAASVPHAPDNEFWRRFLKPMVHGLRARAEAGEPPSLEEWPWAHPIMIRAGVLEIWLDGRLRPASGPESKDAASEPDTAAPPRAALYSTGLPGKPTSWHLIEAECRCRWEAGERYPNDRTGQESPSEWARALVEWLRTVHSEAPQPKPKTLTNKLSPLLRLLTANSPKS